MAKNTKHSNAAANAAADAIGALLNNGYMRLYDGTQPTNADTAITTQHQLAELRFAATAFGAASGGVITADTLTDDNDADATGDATWCRCFESDGTTVVIDGNAGTTGCNVNLNSVSIQQHAKVSVTSFTYTFNKG